MITPQSANFTTLVQRAGRRPIIQAMIEGTADVICSEKPADQWAKTKAIVNATDTSGASIDCGTSASIAQLPSWTIAAWIYIDLISGATTAIAGTYSGTARGYGIGYDAAGGLQVWTTQGVLSLGPTISAFAWHYVAVSCGGTNMGVFRITVDGADTWYYSSAHTYAARDVWTAATVFGLMGVSGALKNLIGKLGYCAVFNRALTHDEMHRIQYRRIDKKWGNDDSAGLWDVCVAEYQAERGVGTTLVNNRNAGTHDGAFNAVHSWVSNPCFTVTYRDVLQATATSGQSIDALATRTSIQSSGLRIGDHGEWFTALLASTSLGLIRRNVRMFLGFDGLLESEYQPIGFGRISDISFGPGHVYDVDIADTLYDAKAKITLGRGTLQATITAAATTFRIQVSRYFRTNTDGLCRIDDEILQVTALAGVSATVQEFTVTRALGGSTAAAHTAGAVIQEVMSHGDTVKTVALNLLLSGGGHSSSSAYDVIMETAYTDATTLSQRGRGCLMSPSDVAITEVAALTAFAAISLISEEDIDDVKDLIERELLRAVGFAFHVKPDGRLSIFNAMAVPVLASSVYELTPDRVYRSRVSFSDGEVVNLIGIDYLYVTLTQDTSSTYVAADATSGTKYGPRRRKYELPASQSDTDLGTLTTNILARYKNPTTTIEVECGLYESLLEIGDAITLLDFNLPNITVGVRGVTNLLCQIVGRQVDYARGRTTLSLIDCSRM